VDWEYPVVAGHNDLNMQETPKDFKNYIRLLRILKEEFEKEAVRTQRPRLLLTAAVGIGLSTVEEAYDIPAMSKYLDLIGLMTYDMHGAWEQTTGFNAPLYATEEDVDEYDYPLSVSWAVEYWLENGASANQLLLGVGSYGRGWKLADQNCNTPLCPTSGSSSKGAATHASGFLAYYEIEDLINQGVGRKVWDDERKVPYVVTTSGDWIGYDDEKSMDLKMAYLKNKGLRGSMIWAIDLDDLNTFPLMNTIRSSLEDYRVISNSLSTTSQEATSSQESEETTTSQESEATTTSQKSEETSTSQKSEETSTSQETTSLGEKSTSSAEKTTTLPTSITPKSTERTILDFGSSASTLRVFQSTMTLGLIWMFL